MELEDQHVGQNPQLVPEHKVTCQSFPLVCASSSSSQGLPNHHLCYVPRHQAELQWTLLFLYVILLLRV